MAMPCSWPPASSRARLWWPLACMCWSRGRRSYLLWLDLRLNLSQWALDHPAFTRYLMVVLMVLGVTAYFQLGQDEDPPFTFRAMVVRSYWPGATAQQVAEQVTDKIERTLQEVPYADKIRSYSKPGESLIIFQLKDSTQAAEKCVS